MPKKVDEWHNVSMPQTPAQINQYFELCTKWLIGKPVKNDEEFLSKKNIWHHSDTITVGTLGLTESEQHNTAKLCHFCKTKKNVNLVLANPFSRKQYITVCTTCFVE